MRHRRNRKPSSLVTTVLVVLSAVLVLFAAAKLAKGQVPAATYRHDSQMALNDLKVTPGAVNPNAVADTTGAQHLVNGIEENVCAKDFRTSPIRAAIKNFPKMKHTVCSYYGVTKCDGTVEGDHLISIELGGCPDCLTNLWPQPMNQARIKDHQVEDVLPKLVCAGKISLPDAQACIASDWVTCGARIRVITGATAH